MNRITKLLVTTFFLVIFILCNIRIYAAPVISANVTAVVCDGSSVEMVVRPEGVGVYPVNTVYQWYKNNRVIAGATSPSYTTSSSGSFTVKVTSQAQTLASQSFWVGSCKGFLEMSVSKLNGSFNPGIINTNNAATNLVTTRLPAQVAGRWEQEWLLNIVSGTTLEAKMYFTLPADNTINPGYYRLLYCSSVNGNYEVVNNSDGTQPLLPEVVNSDQVSYSLNNINELNGFSSGYYTLGFVSSTSNQRIEETGDLLCYDNFTNINSGVGWSNDWSNSANPAASGFSIADATSNPLNYSPRNGHYFSLEQNGGYFQLNTLAKTSRTFDPSPFNDYLVSGKIGKAGKTLWTSFLVRKENVNNEPVYMALHRNQDPDSDLNASCIIGYQTNGTDGKRYLSVKLPGATEVKSDIEFVTGKNYFIVSKLEFGLTKNKISVYVNPLSFGTYEPYYYESKIEAYTSSDISFNHLLLNAGNTGVQASFDEIRVGKTYKSVTPYVKPTISNTSDFDYVRTSVPLKAIQDENTLNDLNPEEISIATTYYSCIGEEIQTVQKNAASDMSDIASDKFYDENSRLKITHLPYSVGVATGNYQSVSPLFGSNFFQDFNYKVYGFSSDYTNSVDELHPLVKSVLSEPFHSELRFENTPLNRVAEKGAPGNTWKIGEKSTNYQQLTNSYKEVLYFVFDDINNNASARFNENNWLLYYPAGELTIEETRDENGTKVREFTNIQGQLILKQILDANNENVLQTYYIYDTFGRLRYILPPKAFEELAANNYDITYQDAFSKLWLYAYKYDKNGRLIESNSPGTAPVNIVYDKLGRKLMSQDGQQRIGHQWSVTKYDELGRGIMSGLSTIDKIREEVQSLVDNSAYLNESAINSTTNFGYTSNVYPPIDDVENIDYYDDYDFDNNGTPDHGYKYAGFGAEEPIKVDFATGAKTGSRTKYGTDYLTSVEFYDQYGLSIQTQSNNHTNLLSLSDIKTTIYDFSGKVIKSKQEHVPGALFGPKITLSKRFLYDHAGRPIRTYSTLNDKEEVLLFENKYTRVGRLKEKNLHSTNDGSTFLQSIDYNYNTRGWLTGINNSELVNDGLTNNDGNDLFGMELLYEKTIPGISSVPNYNGNISAQIWKSTKPDNTNSLAYSYSYDYLNRLKRADFYEKSTAWQATSRYKEEITSYDVNGNIISLKRTDNTGTGQEVDNLTYHYAGNQLMSIDDAADKNAGYVDNHTGDDYTYDANGNQVSSLANGVSNITYNHHNLPTYYSIGQDQWQQKNYAANGELFHRVTTSAGIPVSVTTDFMNGCVYKDNELAYIVIENGKIVPDGNDGYNYQYDLTDHLGNVRVTFGRDFQDPELPKAIQVQHYYPFGSVLEGYVYRFGPRHDFMFGCKEYQHEGNLDLKLIDFGARQYDPFLGRWNAVDNVFSNHSPYSFVLNNPLVYRDPDGNQEINSSSGGGERVEQSYYDPPFRPYRDALTGIFVNHPEIVITARGFLLSGVMGYKFFDLSITQQFMVINDRMALRFQNIMVPVGSFAASMLPTSDALNIGSGIMTGHDMEGNSMGVGSYVMAGIGFVPFGKVAKYSKAFFAASDLKLYRAVSSAELADIGEYGIRNAAGYESGKLFATSVQDATNYGRLMFKLDAEPFHIISTSISRKYVPDLYMSEMDRMLAVSVPQNLFGKLSIVKGYNFTSLPNHPLISPSFNYMPAASMFNYGFVPYIPPTYTYPTH